jgi:menaquinone-specific isochorismate synthase
VLTVTTAFSVGNAPLLEHADARHPLVFLRGDAGLVGYGEAARFEFTGPHRMADAAETWRAISAVARVVDEVALPGSGLVAFGSFAFADESDTPSVLVVPKVLLGQRDGLRWVTTVNGAQPSGPTAIGSSTATEFVPGDMSADDYLAAVSAALEDIAAERLRKIVLARDLVSSIPEDLDLRAPINALAAAYPETYTFAVDGLIGSSPETLVRTASGTVSARVLAGSAARGADAVSDATAASTLAASRKDVAEHGYAIRSVLHALAAHSSDLTASPHPFPLRLPNLWHLASDVTGQLSDGSSALDLVAALHPTAAVAGDPTAVALAAIARLEPFDRGRYAGPVGWVDWHGDGEWAIALRCAQVTGSRVRAFAGAGVITGSEPRRELAETGLKFRPIVGAFG